MARNGARCKYVFYNWFMRHGEMDGNTIMAGCLSAIHYKFMFNYMGLQGASLFLPPPRPPSPSGCRWNTPARSGTKHRLASLTFPFSL